MKTINSVIVLFLLLILILGCATKESKPAKTMKEVQKIQENKSEIESKELIPKEISSTDNLDLALEELDSVE